MEQVTAYKASDGALFNNAEDCQEHEIALFWQDMIDKFRNSGISPYPYGAQAAMSGKVIVAWERFKARE